MIRRYDLLLFVLLIANAGAFAQEGEFSPPTLTHYVTDQTGTLASEQQDALERQLQAFDKQTSTQIIVLMVPTIGITPVEEASLRVAELNRIGRKGRDNGALLFIAKNDRRVRIEVGYGLEGALPDITAGQIIRNELAPRFREGDYYGGISAAVTAMMQATRGEYKADEKPQDRRRREGPLSMGPVVFILIIFFVLFRTIFRRRRRGWGGPFIFPGGFGGRGFGGGGFGGGGFGGGGFSGGGGSFGGGGASGRW